MTILVPIMARSTKEIATTGIRMETIFLARRMVLSNLKQANRVEVPDASKFDLASVQFPRRGELTLPSGPKVNVVQLDRRHGGLHESERNMDTSQISPRTDVPLSGQEMHVAQFSTRGGGSQIAHRENSEMGLMDLVKPTERRI